MSALNATAVVPEKARALAAQLSALFHRDQLIAARLNDAQHRLMAANDRLWSGLAPDAFASTTARRRPGTLRSPRCSAPRCRPAGPKRRSALLQAL